MDGDGIPGPVFRFGDRVQYWGTGPVMHVIATSPHHCYCHWVDAFGALQQGTFDMRNLTHAASADSRPAPLE
jgi:hypothetical protein